MEISDLGLMLNGLKLVLPQWAPSVINKNLCLVWYDALRDFTDDEIEHGFTLAGRTLTHWPSPATMVRLCKNTVQTDDQIGTEVASRILAAISNIGHIYESGENGQEKVEAIKNAIGEVGWKVVRLSGGWNAVCEATNSEMPSHMKKWRDLATEISRKYQTYGEFSPPMLPKKEKNNPILQKALNVANYGVDFD